MIAKDQETIPQLQTYSFEEAVAASTEYFKGDSLAAELDMTRIGRLRSGQDLEKCRFSSTILTQKGVDFTFADFEVDLVERPHTGKGLGNPGHPQERLGGA